MNTENARRRRAARMQAARRARQKDRVGSMTKRSRFRRIRRELAKSGFELYKKYVTSTCPSCAGYRAWLIWTIEPEASPN